MRSVERVGATINYKGYEKIHGRNQGQSWIKKKGGGRTTTRGGRTTHKREFQTKEYAKICCNTQTQIVERGRCSRWNRGKDSKKGGSVEKRVTGYKKIW